MLTFASYLQSNQNEINYVVFSLISSLLIWNALLNSHYTSFTNLEDIYCKFTLCQLLCWVFNSE